MSRIQELIEQCSEYSDMHQGVWFDKEKFAELLIRECADFVQFYYKDHACEMIAHDMKINFGVE